MNRFRISAIALMAIALLFSSMVATHEDVIIDKS